MGAAAAVLIWSAQAAAETLLERGAYLMRSVVACGNCHTPQTPQGPNEDMELAGGNPIIEEPFDAYGPNITPDTETGIGSWTDEQIIAAIREGKRPDGTIIGPPMPIGLYRGISDRDAEAIVAYLRVVKPVKNTVPKSVYRIPLPPSWGPPVGSVAEVSQDDQARYGAYLAGPLGHCIECHTPFEGGRPDFENQLAAGGFPFHGPWGVSVSANITPHPESGIGKWSDAQIKRAITRGIRADGSRLMPPMGFAYYANINDRDLDAIIAYLRSLKPIDHTVR
jgi:mono/diheme cytochrome c family protein